MSGTTLTAIYGSPRKGGNTDILMHSFLKGIDGHGITVREAFLREMNFSPCTECGGCDRTGICVIQDDMHTLYEYFTESDIVVLSAPVFFYGLNAIAKAMVDRCQCFWALKYRLNTKLSEKRGNSGTGVLLSVGGSRGKKNFDGIFLTIRYFFDALDMDFSHHLTFNEIDNKGSVLNHTSACNDALLLGRSIAEKCVNPIGI